MSNKESTANLVITIKKIDKCKSDFKKCKKNQSYDEMDTISSVGSGSGYYCKSDYAQCLEKIS
jgi:hypothetical protein